MMNGFIDSILGCFGRRRSAGPRSSLNQRTRPSKRNKSSAGDIRDMPPYDENSKSQSASSAPAKSHVEIRRIKTIDAAPRAPPPSSATLIDDTEETAAREIVNNVVEAALLEVSSEQHSAAAFNLSSRPSTYDNIIVIPVKMTDGASSTSSPLHSDKLKNSKVIFVLGGPGSGKGTQCDRLVRDFGLVHLSSGDLLRAEVASGSERGKKLQETMAKGELVTLDTVLELLRDAMVKGVERRPNHPGFLIDGFPRELDQAKRFEAEICPPSGILFFDVSEATMRQRLLRRGETSGRVDDNEATIVQRFKTFEQHSKPVVQHYEKSNKFKKFHAERTVDEIYAEVKAFVTTPAVGLHLGVRAKLGSSKIIFVLGGPGSGKGTQCERLVKKHGFAHLSTGDLLRAEVASGSARGKRLEETMAKGELVTLDTVLELLRDAMIKGAEKGNQPGFLIDGFPREVEQAKRFEEEIRPSDLVLFFNVSEKTMRQRLLKRGQTSGRVDDNEETIVKRFRTFEQHSKPVVEMYQGSGKLYIFDAEGTVESVAEKVGRAVDNTMKQK